MSFAPAPLVELGAYLAAHGIVNLGIVGDAAHAAKGVSYHLGSDRLIAGAYSARTARDIAGLSGAASAIDIGRVSGSLDRLRHMSVELMEQCRSNLPGTRDIREIIYSPDGATVWRYDRERGVASAPATGPGQGDDSHLTHTHVSYYRDSEARDKLAPFRRYLEGYMDPTTHAPVAICDVTGVGAVFTTATGSTVLTSTAGSSFANWTGGVGIQLYARPRLATGRAAILIDRTGGPGTTLAIGWINNARVVNVRSIGAGSCADQVAAAVAAVKASARIVFE